MRVRRSVVTAAAMLTLTALGMPAASLAGPPPPDDYYQDVWVTNTDVGREEHTSCWCVNSVAQVWLMLVQGSSHRSQSCVLSRDMCDT